MPDPQQPAGGSRPGVMGDWSEEQNLGQPGNPKDRITQDDVEAAFDQDENQTDRDEGQKDRQDRAGVDKTH